MVTVIIIFAFVRFCLFLSHRSHRTPKEDPLGVSCSKQVNHSVGNHSVLFHSYSVNDSLVALRDHPFSASWSVCCNGSGLTGDESLITGKGWSVDDFDGLAFAEGVDFSNVSVRDKSGFDEVVRLLSVHGNGFRRVWLDPGLYNRSVLSGSGWVPVASFVGTSSGGLDNVSFDSRVANPDMVWNSGLEDGYQKTLWVGSGIPMLCGEDVIDQSGDSSGSPVCNDSVTDSDGNPVSAFCDNTSDCVALDSDGNPECFSKGESFNVDDEFNDGPEYCSKANYWCPGSNFVYEPNRDACVYQPTSCYDSSLADYCNEKESVSSNVQRAEWLLDRDDCSYYLENRRRKSCCLDRIVDGTVYQSDQVVKVYPGGGQDPICVDGDGEEIPCP